MMGFAWGVGGLTVPFVGMLADHIGIPHNPDGDVRRAARRGCVGLAASVRPPCPIRARDDPEPISPSPCTFREWGNQ
jgi:hypothetical protein